MEFSKKILLWTFAIAVIIIAYAMYIQYLVITHNYHGGTEIVTTLIGALGVEVASGTGFYYWKSRSENLIKLKKQYGEDLVEEVIEEIEK